jgi:hypothetical protein
MRMVTCRPGGPDDNSPAIHRWENRATQSAVPEGRSTRLPSSPNISLVPLEPMLFEELSEFILK